MMPALRQRRWKFIAPASITTTSVISNIKFSFVQILTALLRGPSVRRSMILLLTGALDMKLQKGFSLLEILIYVAIISVITLTIGTVFVSLNRGQSKVDVKNEVNSNVLFALEILKQDFLAATAVTVP